MNNKYCAKCGKETDGLTNFCPFCGSTAFSPAPVNVDAANATTLNLSAEQVESYEASLRAQMKNSQPANNTQVLFDTVSGIDNLSAARTSEPAFQPPAAPSPAAQSASYRHIATAQLPQNPRTQHSYEGFVQTAPTAGEIQEKKSSNRKNIIVTVVAAIVVIILAAGAAMLIKGFIDKDKKEEKTKPETTSSQAVETETSAESETLSETVSETVFPAESIPDITEAVTPADDYGKIANDKVNSVYVCKDFGFKFSYISNLSDFSEQQIQNTSDRLVLKNSSGEEIIISSFVENSTEYGDIFKTVTSGKDITMPKLNGFTVKENNGVYYAQKNMGGHICLITFKLNASKLSDITADFSVEASFTQ